MDFGCSLFNIFISFLLLMIYIKNWKNIRCALLQYNSNVVLFDLLMAICIIKVSLYYCLPSVTHLISDWRPVREENVLPYEVSIIYLIEFVSYIIYIKTLIFLVKRYKPKIGIENNVKSQLFVAFLLFLSFIKYFDSATAGDKESALDGLWFIMPFLNSCGIMIAIFVVTIGKSVFKKYNLALAILTIIAYIAFAMMSGVRSLFVWPTILMMYFAYTFNKSRFRIFLPIGLAAFIFMAAFQDVIVSMRGNDMNVMQKFERLNNTHRDNNIILSLFEEIDYRFGAMTTYGVGYVRLYDRGVSAGLEPIKNSLYAPIPRSIYPDKPVPCSYDGTLSGQGMYMAMFAASKEYTSSMTEPASGAHAYWELGILGIFLFSIIPAFYMFFNFKLFRSFGLLSIPLFLSVFKVEYLEPKLWVSCIILQLFQINLPAWFLTKIHKFICK